MKVKIITGYVPIPDHPRPASEYGRLGEEMFSHIKAAPVRAFYTQLQQCWLYRDMYERHFKVKHFEGDNGAKNSLEYHIVNHQKTEWLVAGAALDDEADTFIWMDYGIASQPGVTPEVVNEFLTRVKKDDFAIPGCWKDKSKPIEMSYPNWRFCGSVLIVPREHVYALDREMKQTCRRIIERTNHVSWEVNTLARVERLNHLPIRWYQADHNETQFTNYEAPHDGALRSLHPIRDGQRPAGNERVGLLTDL